jgi:hypothetical protein
MTGIAPVCPLTSPLSVFLTIDMPAISVFRSVKPILLAFGQMTAVLGFIDAFALRNVGIMTFVSSRFLSGHCAVRQTLIDPRLLVVEPLIDFIDARMIRDFLRHSKRRTQTRGT